MVRQHPRVMFYVQHLLGVGHIHRASLVAGAMVRAGLDVHVVLGGTPVEGVAFSGCHRYQLPEARAADAAFSYVVDSDGNEIDAAWKTVRKDRLCGLFHEIEPDVLLIEQFPFGRRQFRYELLPLLETARSRQNPPHIVCSVRDILVSGKGAEKDQQTIDCINKFFHGTVVHGDPDFVSFETTFPRIAELSCEVLYSGYVCAVARAQEGDGEVGKNEVIVAAGGGSVGEELMMGAARAKPESGLHDLTWRFLCGPGLPAHVRHVLADINDPQIVVENNRRDYGRLLNNCRLSISQGGYNTLMDIIASRCPAVVIPFGTGGEDEQRRRSELLDEAGYISVLRQTPVTTAAMVREIDRALVRPVPRTPPFSIEGADRTAEIIRNHALKRP